MTAQLARRRREVQSTGSLPSPRNQDRALTDTALVQPANFSSWWRQTPSYEGDLAAWRRNPHNALDRGGPTNQGITERTFRATAQAAGLKPTHEAFVSLSSAEARRIASAQWQAHGLDRIADPGVALVVGDWIWGSNQAGILRVKEALRTLGRALPAGGTLDDPTLQALNELGPTLLIETLSDARRRHHEGIVAHDPAQRVFLAGWLRRTEARRSEALAKGPRHAVFTDAGLVALDAASSDPAREIPCQRPWPARTEFPTHANISLLGSVRTFTLPESDRSVRRGDSFGDAPHPFQRTPPIR
jgi:lysozyme family protein